MLHSVSQVLLNIDSSTSQRNGIHEDKTYDILLDSSKKCQGRAFTFMADWAHHHRFPLEPFGYSDEAALAMHKCQDGNGQTKDISGGTTSEGPSRNFGPFMALYLLVWKEHGTIDNEMYAHTIDTAGFPATEASPSPIYRRRGWILYRTLYIT